MGRHSSSAEIRRSSWAQFRYRHFGDVGALLPDSRMRRLRTRSVAALVVAVVSLCLAVLVPVAWASMRPSNDIAQIGAGTAASLGDAPASMPPPVQGFGPLLVSPAAFGLAGDRTTPAPTPAPRPSPTVRPEPAPVAHPSAPTHLTVAALGISAPVLPIGVQQNKELAIPQDIADVGWYRYGAAPGSLAGSIVLSGHVDSAVQGLGAMWTLRHAQAGQIVSLTTADHRTLNYKIIALEEFRKTVVPLAQIFATTGLNRLTLVTCGGAFDEQTKSYYDNIVVTALPA